jgi:hypothetical protein
MQVDLGAFDIAVRCGVQVDWLEETSDMAVLNLRAQFENNLNLMCEQWQKMISASLSVAIKKHGMYFEIPDLNMEKMSDDELESLKDLDPS